MHRGLHVIGDFYGVPVSVCLDHTAMMTAIDEALKVAPCKVLHHFGISLGDDSPPGFAITYTLDESHLTVHSYADLRRIAVDVFTCGNSNPCLIMAELQKRVDLAEPVVKVITRF